jgi:group II intron reverse transcriptase/maturase
VVQAATKQLLEPILDPQFSNNSYGFRPGRNQQQAVLAAKKFVMNNRQFVVDIDLEKFFDKIHHDRLISRLSTFIADKQILRLVGLTLRSGVMADGMITVSTEGSVQGSPLSPLLSNVVLDELDRALEERGYKFCRFADDCNIFVRFESDGIRIMAEVTKFIEKRLKLSVNKEKSKVAKSKLVKFLGMTIIAGVVTISDQSMERAKTKVSELTPRRTHVSIENSVKQINKWYVGWANYYGMTQRPSQLLWIECHIRRRLRARIVRQHKRRRYLFRTLVKRGVSKKMASGVLNSNKGVWALSHHPAIEQAYPNRWFIETLGLKVKSEEPCRLRRYGRW